MSWPEHTCGNRVRLEECFCATHLPGHNTLCPFHLAASHFDEETADISLQQVNPKLHKKECDKTFLPHISVEILFAMVVLPCIQPCPSQGDGAQGPVSEQRPPLKDHHKTIKKRPVLKNYRAFSSVTQAAVYLF